MFISIDGPSGSGKTTITNLVVEELIKLNLEVCKTSEPTHSILGKFVTSAEAAYSGKTYACLIAADRYNHIERIISPALAKGKHVISSRYVESSLALQALDGVDMNFVWNVNSQVIRPHISFILDVPPYELERRMSQRKDYSRLERVFTPQSEIKAYIHAEEFLSNHGFKFVHVNNHEANYSLCVKKILDQILRG